MTGTGQEQENEKKKAEQNRETFDRLVQGVTACIRFGSQAVSSSTHAVNQAISTLEAAVRPASEAIKAVISPAQVASNQLLRHIRALQQAALNANAATAPVVGAINVAVAAIGSSAVVSIIEKLGVTSTGAAEKLASKASGGEISAATSSIASAIDNVDDIASRGGVDEAAALIRSAVDMAGIDAVERRNSAPIIDDVSIKSVPENNSVIITVIGHDPEQGPITKSYTIPAQDYETNRTYILDTALEDNSGAHVERRFSIDVANVNEPPTLHQPVVSIDVDTVSIVLTASDPDGDVIMSQEYRYTFRELANGVQSFDVTVTDSGGLQSNSVHVVPPQLAREAALSEPTNPVILGYSLSTLPENQGGTLRVSAYDAIDGVITKDYAIQAQDFEHVQNLHQFVEITNSLGLSVSGVAQIAITNVNESPYFLGFAVNDNPGSDTDYITMSAFDPDGDELVYSILDTGGFGGGLRINGNVLAIDYSGSDVGRYVAHVQVSDQHGLSQPANINIEVT